MAVRFAYAGYRHGQLFDLVAAVTESPDRELVAACEWDMPSYESTQALLRYSGAS